MLVLQVELTFLENGTLRRVLLQEDSEGRTFAHWSEFDWEANDSRACTNNANNGEGRVMKTRI